MIKYSIGSPPGFGTCEICGKRESLNNDHCHTHGWVRGEICTSCNLSIGFIERSSVTSKTDLAESIASHLRKCPECPPITAEYIRLLSRNLQKSTTLGVNGATAEAFGRLRIRLAMDNGSKIPPVGILVRSLIELGNTHYPELLSKIKAGESE
jgi:recombination endonuclease VII